MSLLLIVLCMCSGGCYGYRPGYYDSCGLSGSLGFMAWIVHGSAVLGSVLRFPALGAGLGVGPDLGCAGVGDFLCCCVSFR